MRKPVLESCRSYPLRVGVAGLLLGVPLSLTAAGDVPADPAAPAIQQADAHTRATPIAQPQPSSQFQSQQYQNEVQRQLQLLYQQEQSGQRPQPSQAAAPRKMRMKDWFNPSAWKRQYTRRQRERQREEQRQQAASAPETNLGAPADMTLGGAAPLPGGPSVPLAPSPGPQQAPGRLVAPDPVPATAAAPVIAPAPVSARPQLQRVTPDIFASEEAPAASDAPVFTLNAAPPAEVRAAESPLEAPPPATLAAPSASAAATVDPQVAQTPLLVLVPNPEPAQSPGVTPQAPPAEFPVANGTQSTPPSDITVDGFINEPTPAWESPEITATEQESLFGARTEPAAPEVIEAAPLSEEPAGPFTGLELEANPFVEQPRASAAPSQLPSEPATFAAPVGAESSPAFSAPVELPAPQPEALLAPLPAADADPAAPASFPAEVLAAPAALSPQAGRPLAGSAAGFESAPQGDVQVKLSRIAERKGLTGFKGFCPVMLKDHRELVDAKLEHTFEYAGRQYWFSSATARQQFINDPAAYIPARDGIDVVLFDRTGESRDGSLDHAVWYKGQLYLFDSSETQAAFAAAPQAHQVSE